MLDVSRHFQPISFLKKQIDVMAQYKFFTVIDIHLFTNFYHISN